MFYKKKLLNTKFHNSIVFFFVKFAISEWTLLLHQMFFSLGQIIFGAVHKEEFLEGFTKALWWYDDSSVAVNKPCHNSGSKLKQQWWL